MGYREHGMWEVLDILRRYGRGESASAVEAATGRTRKTIRRYVDAAQALGWTAESGEPSEELVSRVVAALKPGKKYASDNPTEVEALLKPHHDRIASWLREGDGGRALKLTRVHALLKRQGVVVPYSSLHRYAQKHCAFGACRVTVRMAEVPPGELAEVDFGRLGYLHDSESNTRRAVNALIVTLVHSRHQYVHVSHTQKLDDLIDGLENAWEFFGGVPARVVLDNLKAAVVRSDRYDPTFQRTFAEYAQHRGFIIDAAIVRHPTGKPRVERNVQYVRESLFRGETWLNLSHIKREATQWCTNTAGTRKHGTTGRAPLVMFEEAERAALRPLNGERFDVPAWAECTVHPDHHVQFLKAFYSTPTAHIGRSVTVRGDSRLVRIYHKGELIKTHARKRAGEWSTDYDDYPQELTPYAMRDPKRIIADANARSAQIGRFVGLLLAGTFPWAKLRQAQKLLRLADKYGKERVDSACRRALAFDLVDVRRVERIVLSAFDAQPQTSVDSSTKVMPLSARFLRPAGSFTHAQEMKDVHHGSQTIIEERAQTTASIGAVSDIARPRGVRKKDEPVA